MGRRTPRRPHLRAVAYVIEQVPAPATYALRQRVLRPHQSVAEMDFPGDQDPDAGHFAAFDAGVREIIGVVSVVRQAPPRSVRDDDNGAGWWRLRGMATVERRRREGVGRALADAVAAHAMAQRGTGLWCNARLAAVAFYRTVGFETSGDAWDVADIGPHIKMTRALPPR